MESGPAIFGMLPGLPRFFQDLERGDGGRKHCHVTAGRTDFVTGDHENVLAPGELLRSIFLPATALKKRYAFRRFSLTHLGRSEVLLIGTLDQNQGEFVL